MLNIILTIKFEKKIVNLICFTKSWKRLPNNIKFEHLVKCRGADQREGTRSAVFPTFSLSVNIPTASTVDCQVEMILASLYSQFLPERLFYCSRSLYSLRLQWIPHRCTVPNQDLFRKMKLKIDTYTCKNWAKNFRITWQNLYIYYKILLRHIFADVQILVYPVTNSITDPTRCRIIFVIYGNWSRLTNYF